jgi:hypothetical protein
MTIEELIAEIDRRFLSASDRYAEWWNTPGAGEFLEEGERSALGSLQSWIKDKREKDSA